MAKKKQKRKNKLTFNRNTLIVAVLVLFSTLLVGAVYLDQKPQKESKTQQTPSSTAGSQNSLSNPAVAEAKAIADKYFEAARNCDFETANSYRFLPKKITQTKEECQKECLGGLTYKFIKPVLYNSSESGGITTEIASFDYAFGCGDKTYPTLMQMIRSSEDNTWLMFMMG